MDTGETSNMGGASACVTVTVRVSVPAEMVRVALRVTVAAFSPTVTLIVLSPDAEAGDTVHHVAPALTVAVQVVLLVMATEKVPPVLGATIELLSTVRMGSAAAWVTVVVQVSEPEVKVTVAVRDAAVGFSVTLTFTVPLPEPEAGYTVHHVAPLFTVDVQVVLLITPTG